MAKGSRKAVRAPALAPHAPRRRRREPKLPWHRRIPWWAVVVTLAVIVTAAFAAEPIRDAVTFEAVGEARPRVVAGLHRASRRSRPFSTRSRCSRFRSTSRSCSGSSACTPCGGCWRRAPSRDARREVIGAAILLGAIVVTYAAAAFLPRPMARSTVSDETVLAVDFHAHTEASHDGRTGWTDDDVRAWHRDAGFDVAYITDHRSFEGAERGIASNPPRRGAGNDDPARDRSGVPRRAREHSQRGPPLQRSPHRRPRRRRRAGVAAREHHPADDARVDRDDSRTTWTRFRPPVRSWARRRRAGDRDRRRFAARTHAEPSRSRAHRTRSPTSSTSRSCPGPTITDRDAPRPAWTLMRIPGWRGMTGDSLVAPHRGQSCATVARDATRVVERRVADVDDADVGRARRRRSSRGACSRRSPPTSA